jgi:Protein of unknown function (DUF4232)
MKTRLLSASLVAVALLAAAVIAAPAASAAGAKPCSSSGLVIWAGPEEGGGTAGGFTYQVEFTNLSRTSCTLVGYPSVSAVNLKGKRVGGAAGQGPGTKLGPITLGQGETAVASLQIADALNFPKNKCKPTLAAGLRVTVPGGSGAKIAPLAFETCAAAQSKTMTVGVVTAN